PLKFIFDHIILPDASVSNLNSPILNGLNPMVLLTLLTLAIVAATGLRAVAAYFSLVGMSLAASRIVTELRANLYTHLQRLS
ncbi:MAG TPA: protein tyrosine phosphatase, partial [Cyanobacteria bacterium UBA12227]|nr:protein tyrosine phosphatase [Cyanobacteria bacterium UBA12227]